MKKWTGNYVCHVCKKCNCAFISEDYTNAQDIPPHWRYCRECAKKLNINYNKQTPNSNRTPEEQKRIKKQIEVLKRYQYKSKNHAGEIGNKTGKN